MKAFFGMTAAVLFVMTMLFVAVPGTMWAAAENARSETASKKKTVTPDDINKKGKHDAMETTLICPNPECLPMLGDSCANCSSVSPSSPVPPDICNWWCLLWAWCKEQCGL